MRLRTGQSDSAEATVSLLREVLVERVQENGRVK